MFCQECGNKITEDAKFCSKCGTSLNAPENKYSVEQYAKYDIVLTDLGQNKDLAVRVMVEHAGVGLIKAELLVDEIPGTIKIIKKAVTESEGKFIQTKFTEIGARTILKYCKHCGGTLDGDCCRTCGNTATIIAPEDTLCSEQCFDIKAQPSSSDMLRTKKSGTVHCPKCKSQKLQTAVENNTEGEGGGYGAGKGCLGWLLLGPLGLLCGACGSGSKIKTTNKTFFICMDCGNKFREVKELMEEKSDEYPKIIIVSIVFIIGGLIALSEGEIFMGLVAIIAFGLALGGTIYSHPKEIEDLKNNKYEAEYYKKHSE